MYLLVTREDYLVFPMEPHFSYFSYHIKHILLKVERTYIFCRSWISDCSYSSPNCKDIQLPFAQVHGVFLHMFFQPVLGLLPDTLPLKSTLCP